MFFNQKYFTNPDPTFLQLGNISLLFTVTNSVKELKQDMLFSVLLLSRDTITTATLKEKKIQLKFAYNFQSLVHCHYGEEDGIM